MTMPRSSSDLQKIFTQCLLSRRAMKQDVALQFYQRCIGAVQEIDSEYVASHGTNMQGFVSFCHDLNRSLEPFSLEIRMGEDQTATGDTWLALVNTDSAGAALQFSDLNPNEIDFFRRVIEEIITSYPGNSIGSNYALSLVGDLQQAMKKSEAQQLLGSLAARGWLRRSRRGRYTLAPRAMLELDLYLQDEFGDLMYKCARCNKHVLNGVRCENGDCPTHLHPKCYTIIRALPRPICPTCGCSFIDIEPGPIGEKAVRTEEDDFTKRAGQKRKRRTGEGRTQANGEAEDEDEPEDDEVEYEEEEGMTQTQTQRRRTTGKRAATQSRSRPLASQLSDDEADEAEDGDEEETEAPTRLQPRRGSAPTWATETLPRQQKDRVPETQYDDNDDGDE